MSTDPAMVVRALFEAMEARDWALARVFVADDAVVEWTETGERFVGQRFIDINEAYPEGWSIEVVEVIESGTRAAAQVRVEHEGATFWCAGFYSVVNGRVAAGTEHWVTAGSAAPPDWRQALTRT